MKRRKALRIVEDKVVIVVFGCWQSKVRLAAWLLELDWSVLQI